MNSLAKVDIGQRVVPLIGALVAVFLIAVPVGMLFYSAFRGPADYLPFEPGAQFTFDNLIQIFNDPVLYTRILPDTLIFVCGTVALTTFLAFTFAWLIERSDIKASDVWFSLILFPLLVPIPVLAIAWIFLLGPNAGWINLAIQSIFGFEGPGPLNVFSMTGLIVCQSLASTPFVFLLMTATLRSMNPQMEEASGASGASPFKTFRKITLPVLLPGILAPVILVTLITLEQFELPLIIGLPARINVFAYRIFNELNPASGLPNYGGAAAISIPFLFLGMLALVLYNMAIRRADKFAVVTGKAYRQKQIALGRWKYAAYALLGVYSALAVILPALVLMWTSLLGYAAPTLDNLANASLAAYRDVMGNAVFWKAVFNTLVVAFFTALISTTVGALLGWIIARSNWWGRKGIDFLSFMSTGIPSVIVALSVMILWLSVPIGIYGTIWILILAASYRIAATTRIARAGLMQIHSELEEASAASGGKWLSTQLRIVVPLLLPALMSGFILIFIIGTREFTIPLVLHSPDNIVLPVLLWQLFQNGQPAPSAALATFIMFMVFPMIFLARRYIIPRQSAE
ncbi:MAG TPA: iron ABC transporter permease [Xanthobacteraceae bacterium]|nr:iron ABC transporter permease [Xanthobacteraceae bacterium]